MNQRLLAKTKELRQAQGLGLTPLCINNKLIASAQRHSKDLVDNFPAWNLDPHPGSDGSVSHSRIIDAGFNYGFVENTASGISDVDAVFDKWVNSPPHLAALVAPGIDMMGAYMLTTPAGIPKWTQDFGNSTGDPTRPQDFCNTDSGAPGGKGGVVL